MAVAQDNSRFHRSAAQELSGTSLISSGVIRILTAGGLQWPVGLLVFSLCVSLIFILLLFLNVGEAPVVSVGLLLSSGATILALGVTADRLHKQLLAPLAKLEESVSNVCQGVPGARLPVEGVGVLNNLALDIDSLSEELTNLYEDMENRVARQTASLAQKTASLRILYDVASSINHGVDIDHLLIRFLKVLKELVNGVAATAYIVTGDGRTHLVGCIAPGGIVLQGRELRPIKLCVCGQVLSPGHIICGRDPDRCSKLQNRKMFGDATIEVVDVPFEYQDGIFGRYNIYVERRRIAGREDTLEMFPTIGNHLGMALAKQRSDAEARRLSIIEERNNLAHELHDSLAQTLASLRFQVRMLEETLEQTEGSPEARGEIQRIRSGLDEAHTELRELLNSFRAPLDQRGLVPAVDKIVTRFQEETGMRVFFQKDCRQLQLSADQEMQMLRIVQEALTNIRKHAHAQNVRVLLRCQSPGLYMLLVEDDGLGFEEAEPAGDPGEHIGLSIMEERARRLGGELRIESEPGEGTRVEFLFRTANAETGQPMKGDH